VKYGLRIFQNITSIHTPLANTAIIEQDILLEDINPMDFYGVKNANFDILKKAWPEVRFVARGNVLKTLGDPVTLDMIRDIVEAILQEIRRFGPIDDIRVAELLTRTPAELIPRELDPATNVEGAILKGVNGSWIKAKTEGQRKIVKLCEENDVVFAMGPAGSGKTYTAVAIAARALKDKLVKKIVLVRPAVEAGEKLGFLPGDLKEKIDPYLRPLYDALEDMIHPERLKGYIENGIIEIVPLAYMRGRTLNNSFIILDEAQNATEVQLKMFITRMGMESKIIVTGDVTQTDLPKTQRSGLVQARKIFSNIKGIGIAELTDADVVRHPLLKKILAAYEKDEAEQAALDAKRRQERAEAQQARNDEARRS
jgi:phosphate starvation-inducible PhoH-like protein